MIDNELELRGRITKQSEIKIELQKNNYNLILIHGMVLNKDTLYCNRCNMNCEKELARLSINDFYCYQCVNLGSIKLTDVLVFNQDESFEKQDNPMTWGGKLTELQEQCSQNLVNSLKMRKPHLLCAVTGAGKTEILFSGIEFGLKQGDRICICSSRVDVCIELFPRIQKAFSKTSIQLLHGRKEEIYHYTQIVVCTTHQLIRFQSAFDMLIIDEVDSFPFSKNLLLEKAVVKAKKKNANSIYLTATPDQELIAKNENMVIDYLPLRFHRNLLPELQINLSMRWYQNLIKGKLPKKLITKIKKILKKTFLFFYLSLK